jgi:hypothetical protein
MKPVNVRGKRHATAIGPCLSKQAAAVYRLFLSKRTKQITKEIAAAIKKHERDSSRNFFDLIR